MRGDPFVLGKALLPGLCLKIPRERLLEREGLILYGLRNVEPLLEDVRRLEGFFLRRVGLARAGRVGARREHGIEGRAPIRAPAGRGAGLGPGRRGARPRAREHVRLATRGRVPAPPLPFPDRFCAGAMAAVVPAPRVLFLLSRAGYLPLDGGGARA
jgi:hypothetical protein